MYKWWLLQIYKIETCKIKAKFDKNYKQIFILYTCIVVWEYWM